MLLCEFVTATACLVISTVVLVIVVWTSSIITVCGLTTVWAVGIIHIFCEYSIYFLLFCYCGSFEVDYEYGCFHWLLADDGCFWIFVINLISLHIIFKVKGRTNYLSIFAVEEERGGSEKVEKILESEGPCEYFLKIINQSDAFECVSFSSSEIILIVIYGRPIQSWTNILTESFE